MSLHRGQEALRRYLAEQDPPVETLDLGAFRAWLRQRLEQEKRDPTFLLRSRILQLESREDLRRAREEERRAERAFVNTKQGQRVRELIARIENGEKAIEGLEGAIANGAGTAQREKLELFEEQVDDAHRELRRLRAESEAFERYERAREHLDELERSSGLRAAEQELAENQKDRGRRSTNQGVDFELLAREVLLEVVVPELTRKGESLDVLSGVTLGCARAELDHVLVRARRGRSVDVRAIVEVKRNVNDIGSGFRMRQENIAWFRGDEDFYDPVLYRTQTFRHGHFDREAIHTLPDGREFLFDRDSFARFKRDARHDHYLDRLWFFTDRRPLLGLGAGEYARLMARLATTPDFDLEDDRQLEDLLSSLKRVGSSLQTYDVLTCYASRKRWASQILLWDRRATANERNGA